MAEATQLTWGAYLAAPAGLTFVQPFTGQRIVSGIPPTTFRNLSSALLRFVHISSANNGDTYTPPVGQQIVAAAVLDVTSSADGVGVTLSGNVVTLNVFGTPPAAFTLAVWYRNN